MHEEEPRASAPEEEAADGEEPQAEGEETSSEEEERRARAKWYVVHCYSGMETKVKRNIEARVESMGVSDRVFDVIVPMEETIELRDGVRRRVPRRVFPGYIMINMILEKEDGTLDEEVWHVIRHTPGVTGFVGIGNRPTPLSDEEVEAIMRRIEAEEPQLQVDFRIGERVRITSGPFADFTGTVVDLYPDKGKARVAVSFFNRETPVEVDFLQLEKV
ncbi:MAG: transcription termination/antitermination factor NusG [Chloroflexi bacterium]|nr:transcription termination/antitermination factor NusG [Chloroflexota bacterium]